MSLRIVFEKMHGIGNDFVLIDNTHDFLEISQELIAYLANRNTGVGFDQLIILEPSQIKGCDAAYKFFNPDGSEAEQCGNGQRCIGYYLWKKNPSKTSFCVSGLAGLIQSEIMGDNQVKVSLGNVQRMTSLVVNSRVCHHVILGNPHLVTVCQNVDGCNLEQLNKQLTLDYTEGINFEIVQILSRNKIKVRVHERGTGETLACGSGACAVVAALHTNGKLDNTVKVLLPGGTLVVEYDKNNNELFLMGPAAHVFTGEIIL
jgi:diaminopimelate epimerase